MSRGSPLPRVFWVLWAGALLNRLGDFVQPFLAIYLASARGLTAAQVGLVLSLWGMGALVAGPVGGLLADRLGRRRTLLIATLSGAVCMLQMGAARPIWQIAEAALLLGFFGSLYRPAQQAAVSDLVGPADRARAFGLLYWAVNLGFAFSAVVAGALARHGFAILFVIDAATTLCYGAVVWRFVPETRPAPIGLASRSPLKDMAAPFRDRTLLGFLGCVFLTALAFMQAGSTFPLQLLRHGIGPDLYGRLMAINGLLIVALQLLSVRLTRSTSSALVLALSSVLVGAGFGLNALVSSVSGYAFGIVVWTLGEIGQMPVSSTVVANLAPRSRRGAYQGVFSLAFAAANCLAPLLGGVVLNTLGSGWLWGGCFALCMGAAAGHLLLAPGRQRRFLQTAQVEGAAAGA